MTPLRRDRGADRPRVRWVIVLAGLAASVISLALAPVLMPDGYSVRSHTTSESAAQALSGAWLSRLGFLTFGLAVLLLVAGQSTWGFLARTLHAGFGVCLTGTAAFSTRPWIDGVPFDRTEDLLHSVMATAMGFAFAVGALTVLRSEQGIGPGRRILGVVAVVASVAIPLAMGAFPDIDGLLQRAMFATAFAWYGVEAIRNLSGTGTGPARAGA